MLYKENAVLTLLLIVGIWLLLNVLFVVIMTPERRPKRSNAPRLPGAAGPLPAAINRNTYPFDAEEKLSLWLVIISVAMGAFFVLVPSILEAVDAIKCAFAKNPTHPDS
jgi:RsiW-degrading membrane proteinase PrsW (M82 family)